MSYDGPKILTLDIETAPAHALIWAQFKQNIANIQIIQPDRVIGVGAKWHHERRVMWKSEYHHSKAEMVEWSRDLFHEADIIVHFNGTTFDVPWLQTEIALADLWEPSPMQQVDMLQVVRKKFRFMSNKLENVVERFGVGLKMQNTGFQMWRDIEVGTDEEKAKAWALMKRYCMQDVRVEEKLYDRILGWIPSHPNMSLYLGHDACRNCGSAELVYEGWSYTSEGRFHRFHCTQCGKWDRSRKRDLGTIQLQAGQVAK